jgi:hypothetical protein
MGTTTAHRIRRLFRAKNGLPLAGNCLSRKRSLLEDHRVPTEVRTN